MEMDHSEVPKLTEQLATGFEVLQELYQQLHQDHQALESKLAKARDQYNELSKLCSADRLSTPPLSLSSEQVQAKQDLRVPPSVLEILEQRPGEVAREAARKVRAANRVIQSLHQQPSAKALDSGVKIWSGPSADCAEPPAAALATVSESPMERDFTIERVPSKLGCPFANGSNKRLSSHAASVFSRYNRQSSVGAHSIALDSVTRINGRDSPLRRESRRASFVDPIQAEICGLSDHDAESPLSERALKEHQGHQERQEEVTEIGACPIRFLDQHSPEEVATYFEKHKHELPRSHELCVRRYQSNEEQIRQLDAKYGNLVSMIQGLGAKHKNMLPAEPEDNETNAAADDARSVEKIRQWASSVPSADLATSGHAMVDRGKIAGDEEDREPHFDRPLRDIRVGESPSRPWGVQVPARYLDEAASTRSSKPAVIGDTAKLARQRGLLVADTATESRRCPAVVDQAAQPADSPVNNEEFEQPPAQSRLATKHKDEPLPTTKSIFKQPQIVLVGYGADEVAKILRAAALS